MLELLVFLLVLLVDITYALIFIAMNIPPASAKIKKLPKVSAIVAAKEGRIVEKTLQMLKKIKKPKMEIIVVSNDPATLRIARKYTKKVVKDKGIGKGAALNKAVKHASCKILYFLDEDMVVEKDTIAKVCSGLDGAEVAVGYNMPENKDGMIARVSRLYIALLTKMQYGIYRTIGSTFVAGRNFAMYRKTLREAGGFRNVLTEDLDLSFRLFKRKKKVKFINARSSDQVPARFSWYVKQQQRWNVGSGEAVRAWEKRLHHHDILLFLFVVLIALVPVISLIALILAVALKSWLFLSVVAIGYLICLSAAIKLGREDAVLSPFVFLLLMILQTAMIFYSAAAKPKGWYRTPKV